MLKFAARIFLTSLLALTFLHTSFGSAQAVTCSSVGVSASFNPVRPAANGYAVNFSLPDEFSGGSQTWEIRRRNTDSAEGAGWDSGHGYTISGVTTVSREFGQNQAAGDRFEHMLVVNGLDYCSITSPPLIANTSCDASFISVPPGTKIGQASNITINPSQANGFARGEYKVFINDTLVCKFLVDGGGLENYCGTHSFTFLYANNALRVKGGLSDTTNYCALAVTFDEDGNVLISEGNPNQTDDYDLCKQIPEDVVMSNGGNAYQRCKDCMNKNPKGIWTSVGCIQTSPTIIVTTVVTIGLGLSGGIALLMILAAAFLFSTSQGDPKRTTQARELLTSAVIGLLFTIFSIAILQFIGVSILRIPDFGV